MTPASPIMAGNIEQTSSHVNSQETDKASNKTTLVSKAMKTVHPLVNSSCIDAAIDILEAFVDFGKAMPFIAPAFVLLKVIIDVEKRAQDADAKCNDLVERITFMLGLVPSLQKIEIKPALKQIIDRINGSMKDAAALIAAYRKQSRVARRLSFSNREKFTSCAETINECCHDLLISLQIHQSLQLDILTREVPTDDEDKAAKEFVEEHGGNVQAIMHDRELVKEFASRHDLAMDDTVMEQLNTGINDAVKRNHTKLEIILRANVSAAIVSGLKDLALEMNAMDSEQKFKCVQCNKEFTNHANGPKSCSYHRAEYSSYSQHYPCCTTSHPCQFGTHRAQHHCDYPYANFFPRAREVTKYINTRDEWGRVEDVNLETDDSQFASVSQLLRWFSRAAPVEENTMLIIVGTVWYRSRYYFNTFTANELEDLSRSLHVSGRTLIFRTSDDENDYSSAEWILSPDGTITGVKIVAKTATSDKPCIRVCPIDMKTCTKVGEVQTVSEGGFPSYLPASPYVLPDGIMLGPTLKDTQSRPVRTDFKTKNTPSLPLILKTTSNPPLVPITSFSTFAGKVSVYNDSPPESSNAATIASVTAFYRMVGDSEYLPVSGCFVVGGLDVPVTIEPRKSWLLNFCVDIPQVEKHNHDASWWDREFQCRHRPIRIKIVVKDVKDDECSLVLEHVFKPDSFPEPNEADIAFFTLDDPQAFRRYNIRVKRGTNDDNIVQIASQYTSVKKLQKAVYEALKTGETEIPLFNAQEFPTMWEWNSWALVDVSCRRVYAIKVMLKEGKHVGKPRIGCVGYVLCPEYGPIIAEKREISYAEELVKLPPMPPCILPVYPQDDDYDDDRPTPVPPETASTEASGSTVVGNGKAKPDVTVADLQARFDSIEARLEQITVTLDKLVRMGTFLFVIIIIRFLF